MLDQPQKLQSVVMNQQQQQQQAGNLQFMDASSYGASANFGGPPMGGAQQGYYQPAASGYDYGCQIGGAVDFENEPPLLEELGIDFDKIVSKTISVLNPAQRVTRHMMYSTSIHTGQEEADSDMAGPILVALALGAAMLLRGKVHFGYIYGIGLFGCCSLWLVMTLMSHKGVDIYQTSSILGYCLLPMVLLAFFSAFLATTGHLMFLLTVLAVAWCTWRASEMMVLAMDVQHERLLVAYPIGLFYACFALISVF